MFVRADRRHQRSAVREDLDRRRADRPRCARDNAVRRSERSHGAALDREATLELEIAPDDQISGAAYGPPLGAATLCDAEFGRLSESGSGRRLRDSFASLIEPLDDRNMPHS